MENLEVLGTEAVIREEYNALALSESDGEPAALCLSGGGIRSAAFCLGALQSFARKHLLHEFHYLSTVSGGGYIGGWLTRCIAAQADQEGAEHQHRLVEVPRCSVEKAEDEILKDNWTPAIDTLRAYTNYLTPHTGLASSDTWAGVVLWLRNMLINWAVIAPLFLLVTSVPIIYLTLVCELVTSPGSWPVVGSVVAGVAGLCCLTLAIYRGCIDLPSHKHPDCDRTQTKESDFGLTGSEVFRKIVMLTLTWALLGPLALAPLMHLAGEPLQGLTVSPALNFGDRIGWVLAILPTFHWMACLTAYLLAWRHVVSGYDYQCSMNRDAHKAAFRDNFWAWTCSSAFSTVVLYLGTRLVEEQSVLWITLAGPIWVVISEILRSAAYVAVRREGIRTDLDREWLARLNADKLRFAFAFGLVGTSVIFLPQLILGEPDRVWTWIVTAAGVLSGPLVAMLGKSANSAFLRSGKEGTCTGWLRLDWMIAVGVTLFAAAVFMLFEYLSAKIACALVDPAVPPMRFAVAFLTALVAIATSAWVAVSLARRIDINRFSMHATYRNRLVRAFLGSARQQGLRRPDRYAAFDPHDDMRLSDTFGNRSSKALFPVINVALNRTTGKDTARAERKAEPFTLTPLHCGAASLRAGSGAFVPSKCFAGADKETGPADKQYGITLGTAMTISGAAVSPNMGYHSSPLIAFVMTLFNVRLGAWLPNPGMRNPSFETMKRSGPSNALPMILKELAGRSDDDSQFIYLSDGGHFDNLGLHEMLRRRCSRIVVIDAGRDENYAYADLGRTLQHALIDLRVQINFVKPIQVNEDKLPLHGAYAEITYIGQKPSTKGELLYIKPWLPHEAPTELKAFKALKQTFPHESTADQFFTESDFESYRRLGEYLAESMLKASFDPHAADPNVRDMTGLQRLFAGAKATTVNQSSADNGDEEHPPRALAA